MYKNSQGHLTVFCIVFVWLRGPPSPVRIMTQVPWFMYQNRLGPSGGIYYPNFVPCFVYHQLNESRFSSQFRMFFTQKTWNVKMITHDLNHDWIFYCTQNQLCVQPQFYIQLIFKAPLCITLTISDQKIVSGSLFFQLFSTFSKKKKL